MCDAGTVARYQVVATGETVLVCDGCDAVWDGTDDSSAPAVTTVDQYLAARGRPPLWGELSAVVRTVPGVGCERG